MKYEIRDRTAEGFFEFVLSGVISVDGHDAMWHEAISLPGWDSCMDALVDLRRLDPGGFDSKDVKKLTHALVPLQGKIGPARHAYVCSTVNRMQAAFLHTIIDDRMGWLSKLFEEDQYDSAVGWLRHSRSSPVDAGMVEEVLPVCAVCSQVRRPGDSSKDQGAWMSFQRYVQKYTDLMCSHSICPDCIEVHYGEEFKDQYLLADD